jgi:hypothetical protein
MNKILTNKRPEYPSEEVINGVNYLVDRRAVERKNDGSNIIRDPITLKSWKTDGTTIYNE